MYFEPFNDLCFLMTLLFKLNDVIKAIKAAICGQEGKKKAHNCLVSYFFGASLP